MTKRVIIIVVVALLAVATPYALLTYAHNDPSTETLDSDLAKIREQLVELDSEEEKYTGGAIVALFEMRRQLLKTTEDMLSQKRAALIRRVDLTYSVSGSVQKPDPARLAQIEADIKGASAEVQKSEFEAARYSGGLVQSLALMNAATAKLTLSQLQMSYFFEKYGVPIIPQDQGRSNDPKPNVVPDGEAL